MSRHDGQLALEFPVSTVRPKRLGRMSALRQSAHCEAAELLVRAMQTAGAAVPELMAALECSEAHARHLRTGEATLAVRDVLALRARAPRLYRAYVDELAAGAPDARRQGLDPARHVALIAVELGDVGREVAAALVDGRIDDEERVRLVRELGQLVEAARRALADL